MERTDGTIAWPPTGDDVMVVLGCAEADAAALAIALPEKQTARAVSLPMLAVLKLLAWKDRHHRTQGKDAADLALLLRRYLDAGNLDRLYDDFAHLMTDAFDYGRMGAWLLGRDARATLQNGSERFDLLMSTLTGILIAELDPHGEQMLVLQLNPAHPDGALELLNAFHRGLLGTDVPQGACNF